MIVKSTRIILVSLILSHQSFIMEVHRMEVHTSCRICGRFWVRNLRTGALHSSELASNCRLCQHVPSSAQSRRSMKDPSCESARLCGDAGNAKSGYCVLIPRSVTNCCPKQESVTATGAIAESECGSDCVLPPHLLVPIVFLSASHYYTSSFFLSLCFLFHLICFLTTGRS